MPIITISRGTFSGGKKLAESLSKRLGYRSISREVIIRAASENGISEQKLRKAIEQPLSSRERLGMDIDSERSHYLAFIQAALCDEAKHDNVIYHGHGGHLLLNGYFVGGNLLLKHISHVIRVRIIADMEQRIAFAMESNSLLREEAIAYIRTMDDQKKKWTKFLYKVDWNDLSQYDAVVDLKETSLSDACEIICTMAKSPRFQATEASRQAMEELVLASRKNQQQHRKILKSVSGTRGMYEHSFMQKLIPDSK